MLRARRNKKYDENRVTTSSRSLKSKTPSVFLYELLSTFLWAIALAFILRTFLFQPFHIPSSSMLPNLVKGDYIVTSKYPYGYGSYSAIPFERPSAKTRIFARTPRRGDVAVFRDERTGTNVVKRIIGFGGETLEMRGGQVFINDAALPSEPLGQSTSLDSLGNPSQIGLLREILENGHSYPVYDSVSNERYDDTQAVKVPEGHYFVLGDNRDNSADSRVAPVAGGVGFVSEMDLIGRAEFVLLSVTDEFAVLKPWTWTHMRANRFFKDIP